MKTIIIFGKDEQGYAVFGAWEVSDSVAEAMADELRDVPATSARLGRPSSVTPVKLRRARAMLDGGTSPTVIAATLHVSRGALYRALGPEIRAAHAKTPDRP